MNKQATKSVPRGTLTEQKVIDGSNLIAVLVIVLVGPGVVDYLLTLGGALIS